MKLEKPLEKLRNKDKRSKGVLIMRAVMMIRRILPSVQSLKRIVGMQPLAKKKRNTDLNMMDSSMVN
jgi:hypothetical protein